MKINRNVLSTKIFQETWRILTSGCDKKALGPEALVLFDPPLGQDSPGLPENLSRNVSMLQENKARNQQSGC